MAVVLPFAALRYNPEKVGPLEQVLTQPYDKITPEMQREYLRRSPFNFAHLIKGAATAEDTPSDNVYTRAAASLRAWRRQGILVQDPSPAYYAYYQTFRPPEPSPGPLLVRKGFLGLGKLEPYDRGVIFRHEQTLSAPKADRLELLRATRAHLESIFLLYSDPERRAEAVLDRAAARPPAVCVTDEYGVEHRLWNVAEPAALTELRQAMADQKLIIADGHHRYETALTFQRECSATHPGKEADCSLALMTFVNMEAEGIVILPTHRLLKGLEGFHAGDFLSAAGQYFSAQRFAFANDAERAAAADRLRAAMANAAPVSFGALFSGENAFYCLTQRPEADWEQLLPDLIPAQRSLDVIVLHRIALERCLGMEEEAVRDEKYITYVRQFEEGVESVLHKGFQACFFLRPAKMQQVRDIAFAGRVLPQKSTDFYPKLLSGLAFYPLQH
ncbi:MAG TPA: DUF1015 domain-containing protein [Terriglobia bacterium]|nr:DUF1015 domain-containing protein [Terriglobia bacterium]